MQVLCDTPGCSNPPEFKVMWRNSGGDFQQLCEKHYLKTPTGKAATKVEPLGGLPLKEEDSGPG